MGHQGSTRQFEGFSSLGAPIATVSRGKIAWANGELRAKRAMDTMWSGRDAPAGATFW